MDGKSPERRVMTDKEKGSYEYRLKLEDDRERSHRKSAQGAFDFANSSLDEMTCQFEDPSKIALFSDGGYGARQIIRAGMKELIDSTISQLPEPYRDFARAVLDGKSWEDLGMPKSTFFRWLKKVEEKVRHLPPKSSLSDVRG